MFNSVTSRTRVGSYRSRRLSCTSADIIEPRTSCSVDKSNEPHQTRHQLRDQRTSRSYGIAARPLLVIVSGCELVCVAANVRRRTKDRALHVAVHSGSAQATLGVWYMGVQVHCTAGTIIIIISSFLHRPVKTTS